MTQCTVLSLLMSFTMTYALWRPIVNPAVIDSGIFVFSPASQRHQRVLSAIPIDISSVIAFDLVMFGQDPIIDFIGDMWIVRFFQRSDGNENVAAANCTLDGNVKSTVVLQDWVRSHPTRDGVVLQIRMQFTAGVIAIAWRSRDDGVFESVCSQALITMPSMVNVIFLWTANSRAERPSYVARFTTTVDQMASVAAPPNCLYARGGVWTQVFRAVPAGPAQSMSFSVQSLAPVPHAVIVLSDSPAFWFDDGGYKWRFTERAVEPCCIGDGRDSYDNISVPSGLVDVRFNFDSVRFRYTMTLNGTISNRAYVSPPNARNLSSITHAAIWTEHARDGMSAVLLCNAQFTTATTSTLMTTTTTTRTTAAATTRSPTPPPPTSAPPLPTTSTATTTTTTTIITTTNTPISVTPGSTTPMLSLSPLAVTNGSLTTSGSRETTTTTTSSTTDSVSSLNTSSVVVGSENLSNSSAVGQVDDSLPLELIIGVSVAALVILVGLIVAGVFYVRRRAKNRSEQQPIVLEVSPPTGSVDLAEKTPSEPSIYGSVTSVSADRDYVVGNFAET
jgi:hypothetical protein